MKRLIAIVILCGLLGVSGGRCFAEAGGKVRLFILKEDHLALVKKLWKAGDPVLKRSMDNLVGQAKKALKRGPYSVTDKKYPHPGGDQHDFLAYGAYFWPNPDTENGLPWVMRDGFSNPDAKMDWKAFHPMIRESWVLGLAYYYTGDGAFAEHAALLLRTWFIDKKTRMNPNVNYGKVIPGVVEGGYAVAGFGYGFRKIYDIAGILESSPAWTAADRKALGEWTRAFMKWSETTTYGRNEYVSKSNHSTFFHMTLALQAMYVGDGAKARETLGNYIRRRIPRHFAADGTQPYEMVRANNFDYHRCNLQIALDIAQMADRVEGIDAWNFKTEQGAGLRRSLEFLLPYLTGEKKWPHFKRHTFTISKYMRGRLMRRAALGYGDMLFEAAARKIIRKHGVSIINVTYPAAAVKTAKEKETTKAN